MNEGSEFLNIVCQIGNGEVLLASCGMKRLQSPGLADLHFHVVACTTYTEMVHLPFLSGFGGRCGGYMDDKGPCAPVALML